MQQCNLQPNQPNLETNEDLNNLGLISTNLNDKLKVIEVSGIDSQKFLQGQLTNDINELDSKPFQLSAHLTNKGRMLASFIITKVANDSYYLITTSEIIDQITAKLKMFVLRSKVTISIISTEIILKFNNSNNNSNKPANIDKIINSNGQNIHSIEICHNYFLTICNMSKLGKEINSCMIENTTETVQPNLWKKLLIERGIPMIYTSTQDIFIPQHVNFDLIDGVNFKKGCYTGQEIVARTHYLGKVKRRMFNFTSAFAAAIGQKVVSPKLDNQEIGVIIEILKQEDDAYTGLISIQLDCIDSAFLDIQNQQPITIYQIKD